MCFNNFNKADSGKHERETCMIYTENVFHHFPNL